MSSQDPHSTDPTHSSHEASSFDLDDPAQGWTRRDTRSTSPACDPQMPLDLDAATPRDSDPGCDLGRATPPRWPAPVQGEPDPAEAPGSAQDHVGRRASQDPPTTHLFLRDLSAPRRPPTGAGWSEQDASLFLRVRSMTTEDVAQTARWHCDLLPHAFFTRLGRGFVRRWHLTYLDSPYAIALVAERTDVLPPQPVGFLLGSDDQRAHVRHTLSRHRSQLALRGAVALMVRPVTLAHFLRTRAGRYLQRLLAASVRRIPAGSASAASSPSTAGTSTGSKAGTGTGTARGATSAPGEDSRACGAAAMPAPVAVVTAVAVHPHLQGSGIGGQLMRAFELQAARGGAPHAELVTQAGSRAESFYDAVGWSRMPVRRNRDGSMTTPFRRALRAPHRGSGRPSEDPWQRRAAG